MQYFHYVDVLDQYDVAVDEEIYCDIHHQMGCWLEDTFWTVGAQLRIADDIYEANCERGYTELIPW